MLLLRAAQRTVAQEEFDDMLDTTRDRVDEIEGECSVGLEPVADLVSCLRIFFRSRYSASMVQFGFLA